VADHAPPTAPANEGAERVAPEPAFDDFVAVNLRGVRKRFGRQVALSGIDAEFRAGQLTVLMGPNGAGKSTLVNILSTLARPTAGEVHFGHLALREAQLHARRRIGLLTHAPLLYRELSARENLSFFARLYGLQRPAERVARQITRLGIDHFADRPVGLLSRGMLQRVSLARALLPDPRLLLFDEPFTGLDREAIALIRDELSRAREAAKIVVVVSHDSESLDRLCDQLLVLDAGRLVDSRHAPADRRFPAADLRRAYDEALR
jgi:heme exporter protein A